MGEMIYNVVIKGDDYEHEIDWGSHPGWMEEYKNQLASATHLTLKPKPGVPMPAIVMNLDGDKRWVLFRRTLGEATGGRQVEIYAIGWQKTVKGVNVKSITWVYPNGSIEVGQENPTFWKAFL